MKNTKNTLFMIAVALAAILSSLSSMAQRPTSAFSITVGSDFKNTMNLLGIEAGLYTGSRKHSVMATLETDWLKNAVLVTYNRPALVHAESSTGKSSHNLGIKYNARLLTAGKFSADAVAHPWHSVNLGITSAWLGGRISFTHKGDIIAAEVVHDPFANRTALRFVFTAL